ncbi:MAG: hypothetical protein NTY53_26170, partial [Kiritimatiellaeota bacterium]|nr:hypothetical protein [Kiritimatiellota bacterium]
MKNTLPLLAALLLASLASLRAATPAVEQKNPLADSTDARREPIMKDILSQPFNNDRDMSGTVPFAISAYWLNQRLPEADAAVIRGSSPELPGVGSWKDQEGNHWHYGVGSGKDGQGETHAHFYMQSFLLQRIYFLFNSRSEYFPGRMSKAAEDAVAASMWKWASTKCTKEMTRPESMWWSGGSENIIGRNLASLWGAAQIFANHPDYRDRKYADGTPVPEMARAFNDFYKQFTRERASKGLMVEVASGYNDWTLDAWYNIADFSPDPVTRQRMKLFLDLFLADYAIEQIEGVRGGSRHRCYPGAPCTLGGGSGSELAWIFYGLGKPTGMNVKGVGPLTTFYRPSPVVDDLVRAGAARGTYEYVSRRLGKGATAEQVGKPKETVQDAKTIEGEDSDEKRADGKPAKPAQASRRSKDAKNVSAAAEALAPDGGNLLRYTFCTP